MSSKCVICGDSGGEYLGYYMCENCKSNLGLFTDDTINKHIEKYKKSKNIRSYEEEIKFRLDFIEKDYLKKRIKLLHILDRLNHLNK